jgi:hypothetical protein
MDVNVQYVTVVRRATSFYLARSERSQLPPPPPRICLSTGPLNTFPSSVSYLIHFPSFHSSWFDRLNNFYATHFRASNGVMICIRDTMTLHPVNKATQTNSLLKVYSYHNSLICEQYTGDRNRYSNVPMTSIYSMLTRDPHQSTQILFTSLPSVTFLPSSHP